MNIKNEQIQPFAGLQNLSFPFSLSFTQGYSHSTTSWLIFQKGNFIVQPTFGFGLTLFLLFFDLSSSLTDIYANLITLFFFKLSSKIDSTQYP